MTVPDEILNIDTPENVVFGYEVAGIGSRFLAALVDSILIVILQLVVYMTLALVVGSLVDAEDLVSGGSGTASLLIGLFGLIAFAFLWGYYIFFEMLWNGQSPGKRWVGLRVMRTDGLPISISEAVIRNLIRIIDFLPVFYGAGVVTMFVNEQARRLGDLAAGTLVVYDRGPVTLESLHRNPAGELLPGVAQKMETLPLDRLSQQDVEMAERYLQRRGDFRDQGTLARNLARTLLARMGEPDRPLTEADAVDLLRAVAARAPAGASSPDSDTIP